jgi:hypothetical protein
MGLYAKYIKGAKKTLMCSIKINDINIIFFDEFLYQFSSDSIF